MDLNVDFIYYVFLFMVVLITFSYLVVFVGIIIYTCAPFFCSHKTPSHKNIKRHSTIERLSIGPPQPQESLNVGTYEERRGKEGEKDTLFYNDHQLTSTIIDRTRA